MNVDQLLKNHHPFLNDLSAAQLEVLAASASPVHFPAGTRIFQEGSAADHFYLILRGKVALQTHAAGRPFTVQTIGAEKVLGWSWLFPPYVWHFDAVAEEHTDAIALSSERLRAECEADPAFGYPLMKRFAELLIHRLQATRLKLVQSQKTERHTIGG
jgi:CRP-like cAMP-binding protein